MAFFLILKNALIKHPNTRVELGFALQAIVWVVSVTEMLIKKEHNSFKVIKYFDFLINFAQSPSVLNIITNI